MTRAFQMTFVRDESHQTVKVYYDSQFSHTKPLGLTFSGDSNDQFTIGGKRITFEGVLPEAVEATSYKIASKLGGFLESFSELKGTEKEYIPLQPTSGG